MSDAARRIVLEFAQRPVAGRVKTRLARSVGAAEAARIYRVLAGDVHDVLLAAQAAGTAEIALCVPPADAGQRPWLPGARRHWSQGEGELGARLAHAFAQAFEAGAERVLAVGTDLVGLTPALLEQAFEALGSADVVLAPTPDGGYGLIGLRAPHPGLFADIEWSTPLVCAQTRSRIQDAGLTAAHLPGLRDVDVEADLDGVIPLLSILVPALDEAPNLASNLPRLLAQAEAAREGVEVLVVDGGSTDGGVAVAEAAGARVVHAPRGRGVQLAAGAAVARGRWLWTVHADARPAAGAVAGALAFCRAGRHPWGWCETHVDLPGRALRAMTTITQGRARLLRLPYGDQGVLVKRSVYDRVGGYEPVPLMEDVLLARRLGRFGAPGRVPARLRVDGRRWRRLGLLRSTLRNWSTLLRFLLLRADPAELAEEYARGRAGG